MQKNRKIKGKIRDFQKKKINISLMHATYVGNLFFTALNKDVTPKNAIALIYERPREYKNGKWGEKCYSYQIIPNLVMDVDGALNYSKTFSTNSYQYYESIEEVKTHIFAELNEDLYEIH